MNWEYWMGIPADGMPLSEVQGPVDPLLAVSELEQRVNDLVERLRNATIVISGQVDSIELLFDQQNSQNERLNSIENLLSTWTTR